MILDIVDDDLDLILKTLLQAKLVVSMEGSHVSHCCFTLKENCGLLVLQPSDRFSAVHRHWAARRKDEFRVCCRGNGASFRLPLLGK